MKDTNYINSDIITKAEQRNSLKRWEKWYHSNNKDTYVNEDSSMINESTKKLLIGLGAISENVTDEEYLQIRKSMKESYEYKVLNSVVAYNLANDPNFLESLRSGFKPSKETEINESCDEDENDIISSIIEEVEARLSKYKYSLDEYCNTVINIDEDKVDTEPMLTAPAITKEYYKKSKAVGPRAQEGDYLINSYVEVEGFDKPLRSRSEVLIIKDGNKVFCDKLQAAASRIKPDSFPYPGGSWEQGEDHGKTAQREAQEEARINTTNLRYAGNYVIKMKHPEPWCALHLPKSEWWYGYYTEVYVADYSGEFKGNVPLVDQDDLGDKGKFVPIKDIYHKLRPVQKHGIDAFVYKKSVKEDVEFTIET
jgi:8-oxo-dGTP pyrophosphatase MutT (NUDIX family)